MYGIAGHPRFRPVIGIADEGWYITSKREVDRWGQPDRRAPGGTHGYDARAKSMQGLFIAAGPRIKSGVRWSSHSRTFTSTTSCARVMGLTPAKNDGDPAVTRDMLR